MASASPMLKLKSSKAPKSPLDCTVIPSKKELVSHPEKTDASGNYISEQEALAEGWKVTPPPWLSKRVISEIVTFKSLYEKDHKLVLEHEKVITHLLNENIEMKKEIQELKSQQLSNKPDLDKQKMDILHKKSHESADLLERIFMTNDIEIGTAEQALSELGGILKDCKKEGKNSVLLVRSVRGD